MTIIGPIKSADLLEDAVTNTLRTWFPTYLEEMRIQRAAPQRLPAPRSYMRAQEIDHFLEDQLPAVIVVSPGMADAPFHDSDGLYQASYRIGVAVIASANERDSVNKNVKMYSAAASAIILQNGSLGGYADGIDFESEDFDQGPSDSGRTLAVAALTFTVRVADIVNKWAGPRAPNPPDPDTIPGSEWPTVLTPIIDEVEKEEIQ